MSFGDSLGTAAKGAMNKVNEYNAEMQALKLRMESKSSDELRRIIKNEGFLVQVKKIAKWRI